MMEVIYEVIITIRYKIESEFTHTVRLTQTVVVPPGIGIPALRRYGEDFTVERVAYDAESKQVFAVVEAVSIPMSQATKELKFWCDAGFQVRGNLPTSDFEPLDKIFREVLW